MSSCSFWQKLSRPVDWKSSLVLLVKPDLIILTIIKFSASSLLKAGPLSASWVPDRASKIYQKMRQLLSLMVVSCLLVLLVQSWSQRLFTATNGRASGAPPINTFKVSIELCQVWKKCNKWNSISFPLLLLQTFCLKTPGCIQYNYNAGQQTCEVMDDGASEMNDEIGWKIFQQQQ